MEKLSCGQEKMLLMAGCKPSCYKFVMNRCQHGQKITTFCATESCQYKEPGGCDLCLKKYHSHLAHSSFLSQQQVHTLMRKFAVDNSIKPKCRLLQQSIYNYFTELKTELANSLDTVCKNMINQIGYPYLFATNTLNAFKRLKNKEYKKLTQKEFKHFIEVVSKIEDKDLIKQQNKIYQLEMKNTNALLTQLQTLVKNYEGIVKEYHSNFTHQHANFQKVSEMVKNIANQSPYRLGRKGIETKQHDLAQNKQIEDMPRINIITSPITNSDFKTESIMKSQKIDKTDEIDHQTLSPLALLPPKVTRTRDVSLDKKINGKQLKHTQVQQRAKDFQNSETKLPNQKIENLKQQLNNKEIQINEKKKLLLDIMKPSQKIQRPLQRLQLMVGSPVKSKFNEYPTIKKQHLKTEDKSANQSKSSKSSQDLSQLEEQGSKTIENTKNYAFAKLPIQDLSSKRQQRQEIKNRVIIIPTDIENKSSNQRKGSDLQSPLYKKRQRQEKIQVKVNDQIRQKNQNLYKKLEGDSKTKETLELRQNQEKSLALLMKSLTMNAEKAIIYLQASLKYAQNNISAVQYLSYLYLEQNRPKDCLLICNKTIDKIQDSAEYQLMLINIVNNKAAALNVLGRYSQAILITERALRCKQRDTLYKNLGDSYHSIGMHEKAIYNYEKSLKLNSNNDECSYNLAVCLYIQQNFTNSKLAINRALQIQPKNEVYLQLKGKIEEKIKSV